jgi:hypothetical protein
VVALLSRDAFEVEFLNDEGYTSAMVTLASGDIMLLRDITSDDLDRAIWRYMTFPKFISLLTYRALWFSKLKHLDDMHEGKMPYKPKAELNSEYQKKKIMLGVFT